ncbi:inosine-adenosine-guanosine-nucleoside hydrolase [Trypanosoma cruzi Dm28c]|uniref:Inosine-adenosine-guanosine-nucleoside hydrolase n=2 Tax=Trypanosoma cruzi TaxID=5693 RepID=V5BSM6_TRYCR|nr:inosine-adenosine-guanosine-nucleoside hydrolase [Trypanosoma cruzi Dm28c]KAF8276464.1 putative inosine-adenosine-guanosine-nucleosidehydrolase [Trypanosoma cruzi]PBJ72716.1 inosine-adenosine-guanosine-nucleoside hydrolase [Trypanosoma cruzi cruzi]PWU95159.1 putative inosine-adenosine-guanosine-nucleosidehydrolase [Trypanosoma cruzi]
MPKAVILDQDGNHDDIISLALLLAWPEKVRVIGCICTDADCFVADAFNITGKLMCLLNKRANRPLFPIGISSFHGVNPFPMEWRCSAKNVDDLPSLNIPEHTEMWEKLKPDYEKLVGEELLADLVMNSPEKVTICVTGPLSNVAWCIEKYGRRFTDKVEECVIMGGAVDVGGNVFLPGTDGTAEWNIYWDPPAAKAVLECPHIRNVLFSLNSTNTVPVCSSLVKRFGAQNEYLLSQFVGSTWAMCTHHVLLRPGDGYYAWDSLTAAYVIDNNLADLEPMALEVEINKTKDEGRTFRSTQGRTCTYVAKNANAELFYDMVLSSMRIC